MRLWKTESSTSPRGIGIDKANVVNTMMTTEVYDKTYDGIPEVRIEGEEEDNDDNDDRRGVTLT